MPASWKLNHALRTEIRALYQEGDLTQQEIAVQYRVSKRTINAVVRGYKPIKNAPPGKVHFDDPDKLQTRIDAARLARLIPDYDTRSLTARLAGDPLPGDPRRQA
jgi:DNA-binding XRE family transcriptional regulator